MKFKTFAKMVLVTVFLLVGCKSEADKLVDLACGTDLGEGENRDICEEAVEENCGDAYLEAMSIQKDMSKLKRKEMFKRMVNKGVLSPEANAKLKEEEKELEEEWDNLAMSSTCKNAIEDLYDAERKEMVEKGAEIGIKIAKNVAIEKVDGFVSLIVDKLKSFFVPSPESTLETRPSENKQSVSVEENVFLDGRDGKTYRVMNFNGNLWMAENLNFAMKGASCYENYPENCEKYGHLYTWMQAMVACPEGWRLPNNEDFEQIKLILEQKFGKGRAGEGLKSLGFMSVFAGDGFGEKYQFIDESSYLWSADDEENRAYDWVVATSSDDFFMGNIKFSLKVNKMSVRCVRD